MKEPSLFALILEDLQVHSYSKRAVSLVRTFLFNRGFQLLFLYRLSHWAIPRPGGTILTNPLAWLGAVLYSCEIHSQARLGRRLHLWHPLGIVIGREATVGDDVVIYQHVTLGTHGVAGRPPAYPTLEDKVTVYAHSTIAGGVTIGQGATVGAHSLVLQDIPAGSVAVGVPARVLRPAA